MATILLIEDSHSMGEAIKGALEVRGYAVSWATSLLDARGYLSDAAEFFGPSKPWPDAIICDHELPDGDGPEFLAEFRACEPEGQRVPVAYWSGLTRPPCPAADWQGVKEATLEIIDWIVATVPT